MVDPLTAPDEEVAEYATWYFDYEAGGIIRAPRRGWIDLQLRGGVYGHGRLQQVPSQDGGDPGRRQPADPVHQFPRQVLLEETVASAATLEYREYDSDGQLTLHATPSALAGYTVAITRSRRSTSRKAASTRWGWCTSTSITAETTTGTGGGAVKGFAQYDKMRPGRTAHRFSCARTSTRSARYAGLPLGVHFVEFLQFQFFQRRGQYARVTVYPVAKETRYRNEDGTGAIETRYSYSWHTESCRCRSG